jgi:hypothetical protein
MEYIIILINNLLKLLIIDPCIPINLDFNPKYGEEDNPKH